MNKKPTPLQALEIIGNAETKDTSYGTEIKTNLPNEYCIIETALKRLENYEQNEDFSKDALNYAFLNEQDKIKKFKAFEIIKNKKVNVYWIWLSADVEKYNDVMNKIFIDTQNYILTKEEYELLKEIL